MKYEGAHFVEFLRRVIDFPRKNIINPALLNPDFKQLVNAKVAEAAGAKVYLPPDNFFFGLS